MFVSRYRLTRNTQNLLPGLPCERTDNLCLPAGVSILEVDNGQNRKRKNICSEPVHLGKESFTIT